MSKHTQQGVLEQPDMGPVPGHDRLWIVKAPYIVYLPYSGKRLTIGMGFMSDGASIPKYIRPFIGDAFDSNYAAPALCHDALYESELVPRADADYELLELMRMNGPIAADHAETFYVAVDWFGWWVWRQHTQKTIATARLFVSIQ